MKHTVLITVVILCLVVFFTALIAGAVLTVATVGWQGLMNVDQLALRGEQIFEHFQNWGQNVHFGPWTSFTIDKTHTFSLEGLENIIVSGVSESMTVSAQGQQVTARMQGTYRASSRVEFSAIKTGNTLRIKADYPRWGFRNAGLSIDVQIPQGYRGIVTIKTVSGDCVITNPADTDWSEVDFTGVSGSLKAENADWPKLDINNVSGSIDVSKLKGKADLKSVSGKIKARYDTDEPKALRVDTISGAVELMIPDKARFDIQFDTVSGNFDSSRLPVEVKTKVNRKVDASRNGGGGNLSVKTVSGSLSLIPSD